MGKVFECPRCGAGVGHNDTQCWRCGENLKSSSAPKPTPPNKPSEPKTSGVKGVSAAPGPSARRAITPSIQTISQAQGGRERGLVEREKELQVEMEALEADSKELEQAIADYQEDCVRLEEKEDKVRAREEEMEALALKLEKCMVTLDERINSTNSPYLSQAELRQMLTIGSALKPIIEEEKSRLRKEVEREMADKLVHIAQLEEELKAVHQVRADAQKEKVVTPQMPISDIIHTVTEEMQEQLGVGLEGDLVDRRVLTHVERLDHILAGGIPQGSILLINGPAGSMKSTLSYHILHACAQHDGIKGMYFCLEQDRESLIRQMDKMGMHRDASMDNLMVVDLVDLRKSMEGQKGDWRSILMRYVTNVMEQNPFQLFVLDSLESFMAMSEHSFSRQEIQDLFDWLRSLGLTALVISETPMSRLQDEGHMELYVADGAIEMTMKEVGDSKVQRWLRCIKLRGANIDTRYYCLIHECDEFSLSVPMMRSVAPDSQE